VQNHLKDEKTRFEEIQKVIGKPLDKAQEIKYSNASNGNEVIE
jgi:hypothetical protein